jgi:hypothetical protein
MPRHNRRHVGDELPDPGRIGSTIGERRDSWRGEDYVVRSVSGTAATKPYRCPGCDQEVRAGAPHVVTWPAEDAAADDRRHWHTVCWNARDRREPGIQRGRSAPRY